MCDVANKQSGKHGLCLIQPILRSSRKLWQAEVDMPVCAGNGFRAVGNHNARELELCQCVGNGTFILHVQMTGGFV
jgi:hypothetical protein